MWTSTKKKSGVQNALGYWKKHGSEFPEIQNAKQYVEATKSFMNSPPKGTLTRTRSNGGFNTISLEVKYIWGNDEGWNPPDNV